MENTPELPQLWRRFVAYIIDLYFIVMLYYLISLILPENSPDIVKMLILVVTFFYEPLCTAFLGFTIGALTLSIRVRKADNISQKIGFGPAILRFIVKLLLGWLSFLSAHFNDKKQALHDQVANSIVIRHRRNA